MSTRYYDPTSGTRTVKWRWRIAGALNRLPGTCWANLVSWALGSRRLFDRHNEDDVRQNSLCREASASGRCYCGKIAVPTKDSAAPILADRTPRTLARLAFMFGGVFGLAAGFVLVAVAR